MKARLLAHSQLSHRIHSGELNNNGLDNIQDLIAYCARVSNPANQANTKTTPKLLDYLIKHKHWSPFEMASATIEVTTTRDIARQLLRHRSFSFQEFSQRYADVRDLDDNFVIREARLQDPKNRQNSVEVDNPALSGEWDMRQQDVIDTAKEHYNWAIENGIAKEQLYVNGTIRSWIHYCELRSANGTQKEHMELSCAIAEAIGMIYPKMLEFTKE